MFTSVSAGASQALKSIAIHIYSTANRIPTMFHNQTSPLLAAKLSNFAQLCVRQMANLRI
jgi:hypothetical protein